METIENHLVVDSLYQDENEQINEFLEESVRGGHEPNYCPALKDCEPLEQEILCPECELVIVRVHIYQEEDDDPIRAFVECKQCGMIELQDGEWQ